MGTIVARFKVGGVEPMGSGSKILMNALYSPEGYEDDETLAEIREFFKATPSGQLSMFVANEVAEQQFQVNDEFYLKLEKIPEDQTVTAIMLRKHQESQAAKADG